MATLFVYIHGKTFYWGDFDLSNEFQQSFVLRLNARPFNDNDHIPINIQLAPKKVKNQIAH